MNTPQNTTFLNTCLAIGLMSGTSLDGVDAALIETDGEQVVRFLGGTYLPYEPDFKEHLLRLAKGDIPLSDVLRLERILTEAHAIAVKNLLKETDTPAEKVAVIGFHGQTIRHLPQENLTWQIGDPSWLAERTGIPVAADFRRRDVAAGGQGAPLVPLFHQALLGELTESAAILNIGGVANITYMGTDGTLLAGDVGPGMGLLDRWIQEKTGTLFDEDGIIAAQGNLPEETFSLLLDVVEALPFTHAPLPKSADRYDFDGILAAVNEQNMTAADGAANLCAVTAFFVAHAVTNHLPNPPANLWLAGGGSRHPVLRRLLEKNLAPYGVKVETVDALSLRQDFMEAECFAWLAVRRLRGLPTSLPATTAAARPTVGGVLTV